MTDRMENRASGGKSTKGIWEAAEAAIQGREYWMWLKGQYRPDEETGLILMETKDRKLAGTAMQLIPAYLKRKYLKRAIVVTDFKDAAGMGSMVIYVTAKREELESLLSYYRLVQFFPEIAVVSLVEPYGNAHIIGKAGITMEDYVKDALYV